MDDFSRFDAVLAQGQHLQMAEVDVGDVLEDEGMLVVIWLALLLHR